MTGTSMVKIYAEIWAMTEAQDRQTWILHTLTKPVVSSPNRSDRVKHSPGGSFKSFKQASTNLNAGFLGFFAACVSSICNSSTGCRALYMVIRGVPFRRHRHSDDTGSISSPSSSRYASLRCASNPGTCANLCFKLTHI